MSEVQILSPRFYLIRGWRVFSFLVKKILVEILRNFPRHEFRHAFVAYPPDPGEPGLITGNSG